MNGALSVIIDGVEVVGGVWKFRTTSYNTIMGVLGGLALIKKVTGGPLAGIPLRMKISPKTVVSPTDNKVQNVHVVSLEYKGSPEGLQELGYQKALQQEKHNYRMDHLEQEVKQITATATDIVDEDVVDEFYPEQAMSDFEIPIMESPVDPRVVFAEELKDVNFKTFVEQAAKANGVDFDGALLGASKKPDDCRKLFAKWQAQQKEIETQLEKVADQVDRTMGLAKVTDDEIKAAESTTEEAKSDTTIAADSHPQPIPDEPAEMPDGTDDPVIDTDNGPAPSEGMARGDLLNRIQKFKKEKPKEYLNMFKGKKPSDGKDDQLREWVDVIESASNDPAIEGDGIPF